MKPKILIMFERRNNKPVAGRAEGAFVVNDERVEVKRGERGRKKGGETELERSRQQRESGRVRRN